MQGTALLQDGLAFAREVDQAWPLAQCLTAFAATAREHEYPRALATAEEGLRLWQQAV